MRLIIQCLTIICVVALAFWAYDENYQTQAAFDEVETLNREIADARSRLSVLNAEWAYLNRPDRLRALVDMNYTRLQLAPVQPAQFVQAQHLPMAPETVVLLGPTFDVIDPSEVQE